MSYTIAITECPYSGQKVSLDRMGNKFTVCYDTPLEDGTHDYTSKRFDTLADDRITPEEAWSVLHSPEMQYELEATTKLEEEYGKELPRWVK